MPHTFVRIGRLACVAALVIVARCIEEPPGPEYRPCTNFEDGGWTDNNLTLTVSSPACPFVIHDRDADVNFAGKVDAPSSSIAFSAGTVSSVTYTRVQNAIPGELPAPVAFGQAINYFVQDPDDPGTYHSTVNMPGSPGEYVDPDTVNKMLDSIIVDAQSMAAGNGHGEASRLMPGRIDAEAPSVTGPAGVLILSATTWHAQTPWDSTGYWYKWILDGSELSGETGPSYTASLAAGTHTLASVVIRGDNSRDSVTKSLEAYSPAISGPSNVRPFATCEWSASVSGGSSPFSYDWSAPSGSGTTSFFDYENGALSGEAFTMTLTVTDALGFPITISKTVHVNSSAPVCAF